ncbi:AAA family ATPase [Agromyces albus]|uniref:26S protease regulatory subunit n=1 Tax=Agromyces albus TaxID=205332 RepID=A0A4Q2L5R9_9MICO|nr:AAA family ATPase [Agromyces albus]RXZ71742.1 26S protease regulatory subunit [Agromyces albus]
MDRDTAAFVETYRRFLGEVVNAPRPVASKLTPLGELVAEHLGAEVSSLPVLTESMPPHRLADADIALDELSDAGDGRLLGVGGGQQRGHHSFSELLENPHAAFDAGPVDYRAAATGPHSERRTVAFGLRLLHHDGRPVAVLQRASPPEHGREDARLEVIASDPASGESFLAEVRRLMLERSVLRGQVLTIGGTEFGRGTGQMTFLERPEVSAHRIVLDETTLAGIERHVVGIGEHRDALAKAGQHLKRGLLLYGPPGTGKTLTVRHLLGRTAGTTAILLNGPSIRFITMAAEVARVMQPSIVVLEDVDLVANDRSISPSSPVLFMILDALDGLEGDADVTFILTTNRVEVLERALADRPGRIDHAAEIPMPDGAARRRLFRLYADGLPLSSEALDAAADEADGTTGSFAKELMRRTVLAAASEGRDPEDGDLARALGDLLSTRAELTRKLLVGSGDAPPPQGHSGGSFGFVGTVG